MSVRILQGDCRDVLAQLEPESVHCVVTSPPYWGLRDYGVTGQIGLEETFVDYIDEIVEVAYELHRILRPDGTLWLNLGDSYATGAGKVGDCPGGGEQGERWKVMGPHRGRRQIGDNKNPNSNIPMWGPNRMPQPGLKPKDLVGIPWRTALALQAHGWYLRQDIIWSKPNPMPESVRDRCTKAHEYLFLLSKSERYYFDADSIAEPASPNTHARISQDLANQVGSFRANGGNKTNGPMKAVIAGSTRKIAEAGSGIANNRSYEAARVLKVENRNKRTVWEVATMPFSEAHFATFPPALIEPCILAGCPKGGTVLDPFGGAGTTGLVADRLGRNAILIELNESYAEMAERRLCNDAGMFAEVAAE